MVNTWQLEAFYGEFQWLVENMVPREIRLHCKKLLSRSQMVELQRMEDYMYKHNETLLDYLSEDVGASYDILVSYLAKQKGDAFARVAERLRAAVLPTS